MKQTLQLQIIVTETPPGVRFALQRGRSELLAPTPTAMEWVFDFPILVELSFDPPKLTGEFTQGLPAQRFVYINSGSYAGQTETVWARRAKVPLTGIRAAQAREAIACNGFLQASVYGLAKDGGPFCATVPLLTDWTVKTVT